MDTLAVDAIANSYIRKWLWGIKGPVGKWCRPERGVAKVDPPTLILILD